MDKQFYNTSPEEEDIKNNAKAREIIQVILDHGVNQKQILHMIYLLSLELENVTSMKALTNTINEIKKPSKNKVSILTGEEK